MLPRHSLNIVLVEPEIPQNTGNIARLCAATAAVLHLVRPLGFFLTDKHLQRAGMDYWKDVQLTVHDDLAALMRAIGEAPMWFTSGLGGAAAHWSAKYEADAWLFFGKESAGLPGRLLAENANRVVQIPMITGTRGLNLSTSVGIVVYEAMRQISNAQKC